MVTALVFAVVFKHLLLRILSPARQELVWAMPYSNFLQCKLIIFTWPENENNPKNEDEFKNEDNYKNEQDLENDEDLKRKYYLNTFLMTSQLDSHTTTDIKPEMLLGVQTGNRIPHDWHNVQGIAHKRRHFHAKTTRAKLHIHIGVGQGTCSLMKHTWFMNNWKKWKYRHMFIIPFPVCVHASIH